MDIGRIRRSNQVMTSVRILVVGNDARGTVFVEETRTIVVGFRGARIILNHPLNTDQELSVRNLGTGVELDMRVIGLVAERTDGYEYVVGFTSAGADIWGLGNPPEAEQDIVVANVYLECTHCHDRQVVGLNEFEVEAFEFQGIVSVPCKRCAERSLWQKSTVELTAKPPEAPPPPMPKEEDGRERRREKRLFLKMKACIRTDMFGTEVVPTENISKGGFGFKSSHKYGVGSIIEVCVPYSEGAGNIFNIAKIAGVRQLPKEGTMAYGVTYLKGTKTRPDK